MQCKDFTNFVLEMYWFWTENNYMYFLLISDRDTKDLIAQFKGLFLFISGTSSRVISEKEENLHYLQLGKEKQKYIFYIYHIYSVCVF